MDILTEDATEVGPGVAVDLLNWGGADALAGKVRWVELAAFTKASALGVEEQRVNVVIDITAPAVKWNALGDGFKVDVRVLVQGVEGAIMVPVSALFPIGSRSGIFVVEKEHATLKKVSVQARNGVSAWVKERLEVGNQVIVYPIWSPPVPSQHESRNHVDNLNSAQYLGFVVHKRVKFAARFTFSSYGAPSCISLFFAAASGGFGHGWAVP